MKRFLATAFAASLMPACAAPAPPEYHALVTKYCVTCHTEKAKLPASSPLVLEKLDLDNIAADQFTWERVVRKLGVGAMPPQGAPHPDPAQLTAFRKWLSGQLDQIAAANPNPGHFVLHRLNRAEYQNAIHDLLNVEVDAKDLLPPDSSDYGFDNIATALRTSPTLLERYLSAAIHISDTAVGDPKVEPVAAVFPLHVDYTQWSHIDGAPLGTRGGEVVRYNFPADGEYVLYGRLFRTLDNDDAGVEGEDSPQPFEISIDGVRVLMSSIGGKEADEFGWRNLGGAADATAARMKAHVFVKAGPHDVAFSFIQRAARPQDLLEPLPRASQDGHQGGEPAKLKDVIIDGPYNVTGLGDTPSRRRIFTCRPKSAADENACAREILSNIARRAYRRPVTDDDLKSPLAFFAEGRHATPASDFDAGIRAALPRILSSPNFLFRAESDPSGGKPGPHQLTDVELASRLSFFLWSSIPDDELLNSAIKGDLSKPEVLEREVRRMIADKRSDAFVSNFTGQWLFLRNLEKMSPDLLAFPQFDDNLRQDFLRETELFFTSVMRGDRNALDLLNADYTFVNERLAKHYGIPRVYGEQFRRVTLTDPNRRGLLGQGSILLLTSVATRTSPVIRGKWILMNLLNTPPPPPPPNVDTNLARSDLGKLVTLREKMAAHRANPTCASCHRNIDPLGFALENYDATGQWRTTDAGAPIDASGTLPDGTVVDGPRALRQALTARPEVFVGTLTEKMLTYALGRGLETYDMPVVRGIVDGAARDDYRFSSIILGIVKSMPFRMRMQSEETTQVAQK
jgi:hypothetical protein